MIDRAVGELFLYGPLGIMCVVLLYACWHLYKARDEVYKEKDQQAKDFHAQIRTLQDQHREEMDELLTRHVSYVEAQNAKGNAFASEVKGLLDSLARKGG